MKIGIVGTGMIVRMVAPNLKSWGIDIVAVAGTPASMGEVNELADEYGAAGRYADYHDLVADPEVDTVYVAVPNFLHYAVSEAALKAGKDVVCEKPLASNFREAEKLAQLAKAEGRFLWEAVVTTRQPNFKLVRDELLAKIGTIKAVSVNYSQYSSRYDAFKNGTVAPAFDPAKSGGALMDLNLYNLHYLLGLFGVPASVRYLPNIEKGIDTSGILTLDFDSFKAVSIAAKDCGAPSVMQVQGTDGYVVSNSQPNICGEVKLHMNDGTEETFDLSRPVMWQAEFEEFKAQQEAGDLAECYRQLDESLLVSRIQNTIR